MSVTIVLQVWGADGDMPLDRTGTRATNLTDWGTFQWDPVLDLPRHSDCIIAQCNAIEVKDAVRATGGVLSNPLNCFPKAFKHWVANTYGSMEWARVTGDKGLYYMRVQQFLSSPQHSV